MQGFPTDIKKPLIDPDDTDNNPSVGDQLRDIFATGLTRRDFLRSGVGALVAASFGGLGLAACNKRDETPPSLPINPAAPSSTPVLGFKAVSKSIVDAVTVPEGYSATVLYATGDALDTTVSDYKNDGSDDNFAHRSGDHHDGMFYFGLSVDDKPQPDSNTRALMCINHEAIGGTAPFLHPGGQSNMAPDAGPRSEAEVLKEVDAHGASVIEIVKSGSHFVRNRQSRFNRRITPRTPMTLNGPAKGSLLMRTQYSPDGHLTRGMIGNCACGHTPWGTYLTCEENFSGFFRRAEQDDALRTAKEITAFKRVGIRQGARDRLRWSTVIPADSGNSEYARWDASKTGKSSDGSDDFRNTHNTFGWVVEIDPYDPESTPAKRTALGRFTHEGAWPSNPVEGKPLAFYMGDDARNEYVYKYVSKAPWSLADATPANRLATGAKYLDEGTLYAARFNADGSGTWLALDLNNPDIATNKAYAFSDLSDVVINARLAADAAGATRCDRPEWTAVNPKNGEIYITMTENPDRGTVGIVSENNHSSADVEPASPRYWQDDNSLGGPKLLGNVSGQVMRIRETDNDASATTFNWDIFLFASQAKASAGYDDADFQKNVNISGLTDDNDLSKPDGCWFSLASGILWIETDDHAYTGVSNCMLLAAVPGSYGDGGKIDVSNVAKKSPGAAPVSVTSFAGKKMDNTIFKRFLTAPVGAEVTGLAESPDGTVLFVNIQHPGESTRASDINDPTKYTSHWPANGVGMPAYGSGGMLARPRSATIMITKNDGGVIGL